MEGAVDVSQDRHEPVRIVAGEQARISLAGAVTSKSELPAAGLDTSRKRHLTFSGDTLAEIAADFNRYNRSPQIRIESAELLRQKYSGGFDADDPESLVEYLKRSNEIEVVRQGNEIVIRSRPAE
jgi:ferric-dicitrate binding protein FerR (iron transport regulator)